MLRALVSVLLSLALTLLVTGRLPWQSIRLEEGELAEFEVRAPRTKRVVDKQATEELRAIQAQGVPKVYSADIQARFDTLTMVKATFSTLKLARLSEETSMEQRVRQLDQDLPMRLPGDALVAALTVENPATLDELSLTAQRWIDETFARFPLHNDTDDLARQQERLAGQCEQLPIRNRDKDLLKEVLAGALTRPNLIYDAEATELAREEAAASVAPVFKDIKEGEVLIRKGDRVTAEDLVTLADFGLYTRRTGLHETISAFAVVVCLLLLLGTYVRRHVPEVWTQPRLWTLLALLLVLATGVQTAGLHLGWPPAVALPVVATVGMLVCVLLDTNLALMVSAVLALVLGFIYGGEVWFPAAAWMAALVGIFGVSELQSRTQIAQTGLFLAAVNAGALAAIGTLAQLPAADILRQVSVGAAGGIGAAILTLGLAMFLERPFRLTTDLRLLELSNPNEPLLRRLLVEAPGTYHASIIIANLAEAAADSVGADSLSVRVACYYHDIGKLRRPYLFVENQFGAKNPHDSMSPSLSVLAIQAHVKDGLQIGRKFRLPDPVLDVIAQHHGTTLVSFFYRQALSAGGDPPPEECDYRYPGPKPQTRESAIVMLADGVEAAVRALSNPTPNAVSERIRKIIRHRLEDGQLTDCDLTLRDLERIETTFTRIMSGIMHKRIEYPQAQAKLHAGPGDAGAKADNGNRATATEPNAAAR